MKSLLSRLLERHPDIIEMSKAWIIMRQCVMIAKNLPMTEDIKKVWLDDNK